jgi:hypothetical protein
MAIIAINGIPNQPIARLLATPRGAKVSLWTSTGLTEWILVGDDPTILPINIIEHRLVHFVYNPGNAQNRPPSYLNLFVVCNTPNERAAVALLKIFQRITGVANVRVSVRPDVWFLEGEYPDVYRYVERVVLPDPKTYDTNALISCSAWSGRRPTCHRGMYWLER